MPSAERSTEGHAEQSAERQWQPVPPVRHPLQELTLGAEGQPVGQGAAQQQQQQQAAGHLALQPPSFDADAGTWLRSAAKKPPRV